MSQSTFSVRMDENLKGEFESLCNDFGMNMTTAINVFARAVVRERKIPFEIVSSMAMSRENALSAFNSLREKAKNSDVKDLSLEEINKEIQKSRYGEEV